MNSQNRSKNVSLGIFAKQPRPGFVKTRLARESSPEWAARVAEFLLNHTLRQYRELPVRKFVVFDPPEARDEFADRVLDDYLLVHQVSGTLGDRMQAFFKQRFADHDTRVGVIGTDSPAVPQAWIEEGFHRLETFPVVLGPARDGGYYFLGSRLLIPEIFSLQSWGTSTVLADTLAILKALSLDVFLLPEGSDIDTLADWYDFCRAHW